MGLPKKKRVASIASIIFVGAFAITLFEGAGGTATTAPVSYADRMGTRYTSPPAELNAVPRVTEIPIPATANGDAIWGSTGRDASGHIWIGVSTAGKGGSAHLFEYAPDTGALTDHGDVVSELKNAGVYKDGEGQIKIHTKIIQATDGYLYFASFDEEGESASRAVAPKWGGHLWRLKPGSAHWEHLFAAPEGLVSVAGNGNWIYALGYWDHILYQYNTQKKTWRHIRVGSVKGHASRNIVADSHGHVYVPRAREWTPDEAALHPKEIFSAELVEFDSNLNEIGATPLTNYADAHVGRDSHGLIGLTYMADGSIMVTTHVGYLYRINPADTGPAKVEALGWLHPDGASYAGSLFPIDGKRYLAGIVTTGNSGYQWVVYDLQTGKSVSQILPFARDVLLFGSSTRDNNGRFYAVGRQKNDSRGYKPVLLQVQIPN